LRDIEQISRQKTALFGLGDSLQVAPVLTGFGAKLYRFY